MSVTQWGLTLCDPLGTSALIRFLCPWNCPGKNIGVILLTGDLPDSEYSLEGLMLKLQYFGHLMRRVDSLEKTLLLGKIEDRRRRG